MKHLLRTLEGRLAALPVPMAVQLPAGQQLGAPEPAVTLRFRDRMALVALASGVSVMSGQPSSRGAWRSRAACVT